MILFDIETAGLNPLHDKILTIQVKQNGKTKVWKIWEEQDEASMIKKFLDFLKNVDEPIVGYNIFRFDINFIIFRLITNRKFSSEVDNLIQSKEWIDILNYQHNGVHGMENWARELGINRISGVKSKHVPVLYELKQYEKIEEHAREDLDLCESIIQKLNLSEEFA